MNPDAPVITSATMRGTHHGMPYDALEVPYVAPIVTFWSATTAAVWGVRMGRGPNLGGKITVTVEPLNILKELFWPGGPSYNKFDIIEGVPESRVGVPVIWMKVAVIHVSDGVEGNMVNIGEGGLQPHNTSLWVTFGVGLTVITPESFVYEKVWVSEHAPALYNGLKSKVTLTMSCGDQTPVAFE